MTHRNMGETKPMHKVGKEPSQLDRLKSGEHTKEWKKLNESQRTELEFKQVYTKHLEKKAKTEANEQRAWADFAQIIEDNKRQRNYSRTQLGFEDCMVEFATACVAMGKALSYSSPLDFIAMHMSEDARRELDIKFVKKGVMLTDAAKAVAAAVGLVAVAAAVVSSGGSLMLPILLADAIHYDSTGEHYYERRSTNPSIQYNVVINDATGRMEGRELVVGNLPEKLTDEQLEANEHYFDAGFMAWLDKNGYDFEKGTQVCKHRDTGETLTTAKYKALNERRGESLIDFIEQRMQVQVSQKPEIESRLPASVPTIRAY